MSQRATLAHGSLKGFADCELVEAALGGPASITSCARFVESSSTITCSLPGPLSLFIFRPVSTAVRKRHVDNGYQLALAGTA